MVTYHPGDWPWGEGGYWALIVGCSYLTYHQVAGLPISNSGNSGCWELRLADEFVYSSFIHSWFLFPKHFGLLICASRHCAGCEEKTKAALSTTLYSAASHTPRPGSVTTDQCLWGRPPAWACSHCSHVGWCPCPLFWSESQVWISSHPVSGCPQQVTSVAA